VDIIQSAPELSDYWIFQFAKYLNILHSLGEREKMVSLYLTCKPLLLSREIGVNLCSVLLNFNWKIGDLIEIIGESEILKTLDFHAQKLKIENYQTEMNLMFDKERNDEIPDINAEFILTPFFDRIKIFLQNLTP